MKRLVLLRHAKAVPAAPDLEDSDRRLADSGRSDAIRMGQFLYESDCVPNLVFCSTALRTRETLELAGSQLHTELFARYMQELYLARWQTIEAVLHTVPANVGTFMLVGHNPGLEDAARRLARPPGDVKTRKLHELLAADYPPAAVTVLEFDVAQWSAVDRGEGELAHFVRPRDLRGPG